MATKHEVIELHRKHPKLNSVQIADRLACEPEYVRATFYREGLTLAGSKRSKQKRKLSPRRAVA